MLSAEFVGSVEFWTLARLARKRKEGGGRQGCMNV